MFKMQDSMAIESGGEVTLVYDAEWLFIGMEQQHMICGVHLSLEEAEALRDHIDKYIDWTRNKSVARETKGAKGEPS